MKPTVYCLSNNNSYPVSLPLKQLAPDISLEQIDRKEIKYEDINILKEIAKTNDSQVNLGWFLSLSLSLFFFSLMF